MTLARLLGLTGLMKKASLVGAFFVPAIWYSVAQAQVLCPAPRAVTYAQVERVVDGDSLRLKDGRSVRLIGLNAPETGKKGRPDEPFADAARKRLQALVTQSDGRVGLLPGLQPQDRYGRTLAMFSAPMAAISKHSCSPMAWGFKSPWRLTLNCSSASRLPSSVRVQPRSGCGDNHRCWPRSRSAVRVSRWSVPRSPGCSETVVACGLICKTGRWCALPLST